VRQEPELDQGHAVNPSEIIDSTVSTRWNQLKLKVEYEPTEQKVHVAAEGAVSAKRESQKLRRMYCQISQAAPAPSAPTAVPPMDMGGVHGSDTAESVEILMALADSHYSSAADVNSNQ
jgi:hypothetical protein